jgi:hypothetical protein
MTVEKKEKSEEHLHFQGHTRKRRKGKKETVVVLMRVLDVRCYKMSPSKKEILMIAKINLL